MKPIIKAEDLKQTRKRVLFGYIGGIGLLLFIVAISIIGFFQYTQEPMLYQGPVPEGYDEEHFRKTGETIKEIKEEVSE